MIIIVSSPDDVHARAVQGALARRGVGSTILDLSTFPRSARLSMGYDAADDLRVIETEDGVVDLAAARAVWWPRPYGVDPAITDDAAHAFVVDECHEAVEGMWLTLDAEWINPPAADAAAARKPWQLHLARSCGLEIPPTLITSDPAQARAFAEAMGPDGCVYKAFQGSERAWRETRVLRPGEIDLINSVRHAPVIFQRNVVAEADLRVTVVDGRVFAAAIRIPAGRYQSDFRMEMGAARIEPFALPPEAASALLRLMRRMGIVYGAADFRLTPDGRCVFLEINPAGQWLFVEDATGQPISEAMAAALAARDRPHAARAAE